MNQSPTKILFPILDDHLKTLKQRWFAEAHENVGHDVFVNTADEWFKSTKLNNVIGW